MLSGIDREVVVAVLGSMARPATRHGTIARVKRRLRMVGLLEGGWCLSRPKGACGV